MQIIYPIGASQPIFPYWCKPCAPLSSGREVTDSPSTYFLGPRPSHAEAKVSCESRQGFCRLSGANRRNEKGQPQKWWPGFTPPRVTRQAAVAAASEQGFAGTAGCSDCRAHLPAPTLVACGDGTAFGPEIIAGVLQIINRTPAMIADLTFISGPRDDQGRNFGARPSLRESRDQSADRRARASPSPRKRAPSTATSRSAAATPCCFGARVVKEKTNSAAQFSPE